MLALFADIHSNLEALRACLEHARSRGATRHVFLGDLVGYGADPKAVLEVVRNHAAAGALVVQGNHDAAVAGSSAGLTEDARDTVLWTRELLSKEEIAWLRSLPLCIREEQTCFVHASAASPERWEYVEHPPAAKRSADAAGSIWTFGG